jgi:hypothetical protein
MQCEANREGCEVYSTVAWKEIDWALLELLLFTDLRCWPSIAEILNPAAKRAKKKW